MQALGQGPRSAFQTIRNCGRRQAISYITGNERSGIYESRKLGSGIPGGNERSDTSVEIKGSELVEGNERFDT
jgi:hypothetical protein